jgi:hypothetical protein
MVFSRFPRITKVLGLLGLLSSKEAAVIWFARDNTDPAPEEPPTNDPGRVTREADPLKRTE